MDVKAYRKQSLITKNPFVDTGVENSLTPATDHSQAQLFGTHFAVSRDRTCSRSAPCASDVAIAFSHSDSSDTVKACDWQIA